MKKRTITLSNRPPVRINEEDWPLIASARDNEHDGQVECQSNSRSRWFIGVRQHGDGRAIVYATYSFSTNWQGRRDYSAARGVLMTADRAAEEGEIVDVITIVADDISNAECDGDDAARWGTLTMDCIADLPAEEL